MNNPLRSLGTLVSGLLIALTMLFAPSHAHAIGAPGLIDALARIPTIGHSELEVMSHLYCQRQGCTDVRKLMDIERQIEEKYRTQKARLLSRHSRRRELERRELVLAERVPNIPVPGCEAGREWAIERLRDQHRRTEEKRALQLEALERWYNGSKIRAF